MTVAKRDVSGKHVMLCSGMQELQNCFKKALKFHIIQSNHTPFYPYLRHLCFEAPRRDDWNENHIINAQLCSAHVISGRLTFNQPVCCDMQRTLY